MRLKKIVAYQIIGESEDDDDCQVIYVSSGFSDKMIKVYEDAFNELSVKHIEKDKNLSIAMENAL